MLMKRKSQAGAESEMIGRGVSGSRKYNVRIKENFIFYYTSFIFQWIKGVPGRRLAPILVPPLIPSPTPFPELQLLSRGTGSIKSCSFVYSLITSLLPILHRNDAARLHFIVSCCLFKNNLKYLHRFKVLWQHILTVHTGTGWGKCKWRGWPWERACP
jgi:hypothetical protein